MCDLNLIFRFFVQRCIDHQHPPPSPPPKPISHRWRQIEADYNPGVVKQPSKFFYSGIALAHWRVALLSTGPAVGWIITIRHSWRKYRLASTATFIDQLINYAAVYSNWAHWAAPIFEHRSYTTTNHISVICVIMVIDTIIPTRQMDTMWGQTLEPTTIITHQMMWTSTGTIAMSSNSNRHNRTSNRTVRHQHRQHLYHPMGIWMTAR